MRVVVLHNDPSEDACVAPEDVLLQRDTVRAGLERLGHTTACIGCTLDLAALRTELRAQRPELVFNLVESLGGTDRLMTLASLLLDSLEIPYTGAHTQALLETSNKIRAKEWLLRGGLPTPAYRSTSTPGAESHDSIKHDSAAGHGAHPWIIKATWEHASFAMDDSAVVRPSDFGELERRLHEREQRIGRPHFAEQFIDGREFNLSVLAGSRAGASVFRPLPQVLPPAEIVFTGFPAGKPRIVGQRAKWDADSFEYRETPRRFDFPAADDGLLQELAELARRCWQQFDLRGYARVDFRVDESGRPWILEVNANPCLSPDAGFAVAVARAGLDYDDALARILADAR